MRGARHAGLLKRLPQVRARLWSGALVHLCVGEREEFLLPDLPRSLHFLGIAEVYEVRGTGSSVSDKERRVRTSRAGEERSGTANF